MSAEGRSFWPSLALVAVCVVATASAGLPVAQIGELTVPADSLAVIWDPDSVDPIRQSVLKDLQDVLGDNRYWLASHPNDPNIDCAEVKANTLKALAGKQAGGANWFEGTDTVWHGAYGETYMQYDEIVLTRVNVSTETRRGTAIHEAQHLAGELDEGKAQDAVGCFDHTKANEDDDDDDGDGGGGGGTTWIPGETCTTQMVWVEKWRPCSGNSGGGGGSSCTWAIQYCTVPGVSACVEKYYELEEKVTCS